jgi:hypothetical protein
MSFKNFICMILVAAVSYYFLYEDTKTAVSLSEEMADPTSRRKALTEMDEAMSKVLVKQSRQPTNEDVRMIPDESAAKRMEDVRNQLKNTALDQFAVRTALLQAAMSLSSDANVISDLCVEELESVSHLYELNPEASAAFDGHVQSVLMILFTASSDPNKEKELQQRLASISSSKIQQMVQAFKSQSEPVEEQGDSKF